MASCRHNAAANGSTDACAVHVDKRSGPQKRSRKLLLLTPYSWCSRAAIHYEFMSADEESTPVAPSTTAPGASAAAIRELIRDEVRTIVREEITAALKTGADPVGAESVSAAAPVEPSARPSAAESDSVSPVAQFIGSGDREPSSPQPRSASARQDLSPPKPVIDWSAAARAFGTLLGWLLILAAAAAVVYAQVNGRTWAFGVTVEAEWLQPVTWGAVEAGVIGLGLLIASKNTRSSG